MTTNNDVAQPAAGVELLPCPFCGEPPTLLANDDVACRNPQCAVQPRALAWNSALAWNARVDDRTPPPDLQQRAQRAVEKLITDSDLHYLLCVATDEEKQQLADIIAREFDGGVGHNDA